MTTDTDYTATDWDQHAWCVAPHEAMVEGLDLVRRALQCEALRCSWFAPVPVSTGRGCPIRFVIAAA